jgi:hypothetical protein
MLQAQIEALQNQQAQQAQQAAQRGTEAVQQKQDERCRAEVAAIRARAGWAVCWTNTPELHQT